MNFLVKILLRAVAVIIVSYLLKGVIVDDFVSALIVAFVLAILNSIIRPILIVLTIPITIVTLGLFLIVINALMIMLAGSLVPGFYVEGFWWALFFSILLSITNSLLGDLSKKKDQK